MIAQNWQYLENAYGLQKVGVIIFKQIFQIDPSIRDLFSYGQDQNIYQNAALRAHALAVVQNIGKAIEHLSDLDGQAYELKMYGRALMKLGIQKDHHRTAVRAMMNMLTMGLQAQLTQESKVAWSKLLKYASEFVISDNYEFPDQSDFSEIELTQQDIMTLKESWALVEKLDLMIVGRQLFQKIFNMNPKIKEEFAKKYDENVFQDEKFIRHCTKVVKHIGQAIHQLDDLENLAQFLSTYNIELKPQHHSVFEKAFVDVLSQNLKAEKFPTETKKVWQRSLRLITESMNKADEEVQMINSSIRR